MGDTAWLTSALATAYGAAADLGLLVDVIHEPWVGQDALGAPSYAAPIQRQAFVQEGAMHTKKQDGQVVTTKARVSFLSPVEPNGAAGRQEPVDPRDLITLPSGLVCHVIEVPGVLVNSSTGAPYLRPAWLA